MRRSTTPRSASRDGTCGRTASRRVGARRAQPRIRGVRSLDHREQPPRFGNALELVRATVLERDARPGDEVLHGLRDEDLPGLRAGGDAGRDMDGDPAELRLDALALARVDSCPDLDAELGGARLNRLRAPDRARGTVERRHESVAGAVDLLPAESHALATHRPVTTFTQL